MSYIFLIYVFVFNTIFGVKDNLSRHDLEQPFLKMSPFRDSLKKDDIQLVFYDVN